MPKELQKATAQVRCPFFNQYNNNNIQCEGLFEETWTMIRFRHSDDREWHMCNYCEKDYTRCGYFRALVQLNYGDLPQATIERLK